VIACEVNTAAPLTEALKHGTPTPVTFHSSFVDGIGSNCVLDHVWDTVRDVVDEAVVVSLDDIRGAVRLLAERHHVIAEGAGAATTAAVLAGKLPEGAKNVVCIVSGGNIDFDVLSDILAGDKQQC
jgi:threonine dehydratase